MRGGRMCVVTCKFGKKLAVSSARVCSEECVIENR